MNDKQEDQSGDDQADGGSEAKQADESANDNAQKGSTEADTRQQERAKIQGALSEALNDMKKSHHFKFDELETLATKVHTALKG